jgi:hypothetical protein
LHVFGAHAAVPDAPRVVRYGDPRSRRERDEDAIARLHSWLRAREGAGVGAAEGDVALLVLRPHDDAHGATHDGVAPAHVEPSLHTLRSIVDAEEEAALRRAEASSLQACDRALAPVVDAVVEDGGRVVLTCTAPSPSAEAGPWDARLRTAVWVCDAANVHPTWAAAQTRVWDTTRLLSDLVRGTPIPLSDEGGALTTCAAGSLTATGATHVAWARAVVGVDGRLYSVTKWWTAAELTSHKTLPLASLAHGDAVYDLCHDPLELDSLVRDAWSASKEAQRVRDRVRACTAKLRPVPFRWPAEPVRSRRPTADKETRATQTPPLSPHTHPPTSRPSAASLSSGSDVAPTSARRRISHARREQEFRNR